MMTFLETGAKLASIIVVFVLAAPVFAGNDNPRCPQHNIDHESYLRSIELKPLAGMDPFELLFIQNHEQKLAKKLNDGFDINSCGGPFDSSLLGLAAALGLMDDVKTLVARGAKLESPKSSRGESALILAVSANRYEVANYLLRRGADKQTTYGNEYRYNALHAVAGSLNDRLRNEKKETLLAREFMRAGVSPDARDENPLYGMTPMIWAVVSDKPSLVDLFMKCGADPHIKDNKGRNSFDIAKSLKRAKILEILQSSPASASCGSVRNEQDKLLLQTSRQRT